MELFVAEVYPESHRFYQSNDPKHTSHIAKDYYKNSAINWWYTPPESPDLLNPIELVWHELKHFLQKTAKPKNKELVETISTFWSTRMTPENCVRYIEHLKKCRGINYGNI